MNDLKYKAKLDIEDVKKAKAELLKMFKDIGIKSSDGFSGKPLTEYQAGLLKIKQDALEFAKQKAEQARADKAASLATQEALKQERLLIQQRNAELKNKPRVVDFGNSSAEVAASMASNSTGGVVNPAFTQYLKQVKADFDAGKISAAQYTAELERYSTVLVEGNNQTRNASKATKDLTLSKKELEIIAAQEKLNTQQNANALKNSVREMNAAKGSIEQRRAALIRLNTVYDNLNANERNSASGQRLKGIVGSLTDQVKTLEAETGRAQRNVGNYTSALGGGLTKVWSGLKLVANILPGLSIAGLLGFALDPILAYIKTLDIFKDKLSQVKENLSAYNEISENTSKSYAADVTSLKILYNAATNVNLSIKDRIKAANELKEQYPNSFANSKTQAILNGEEADKYRDLTKEILLNARARAVKDKLVDIEAKRADIAVQKNKINTATENEIERQSADLIKRTNDKNALYTDAQNKFKTSQEQSAKSINESIVKPAIERNKAAVKVQDQQDKLLEGQSKFLIKYAGQDRLVDAVIKGGSKPNKNGKPTKLSVVKPEDNSKDLAEQAKFYSDLLKVEEDYYRSTLTTREREEFDLGKKYTDLLAREKNTASDVLKIKAAQKLEEKQLDEKYLAEDQAKYEKLSASLVTYEQQRATLIEKYNEQRNLLIKNKEFAKLTVLDTIHKAEINQLDDQNNEKLSAYKALFSDVEKLGKDSLKKIIDDGEKLLAKQLLNGSISPEMAKKTAEQIANLKENLDNATSEGLVKIGNELRNLGGIIGQTNEGFGKWISTLGGVVGGISDISSKITALQKLPKGDVLGGISGGLGIAGAAFGVFQAVAGLLDKSAEQDEARKRATDYQIKQQDAMNKLLERQVALIQDAYGTGKLLKYSEALKTATENEKKYLGQLKGRIALTGDKNFDKAIENYNNGLGTKGLNIESRSIYKSLINGNFGSLKDKIIDVNGSIEDLYKLLDNSSLDDATRNLLENLIKSKEAIIEVNNSIKEERTGTSFKQLGDDIVDALSRGEDAAKNFEDAIKKAMINSLKTEAFKAELQKFYDDFALLSEGDLTASEIAILRAQYDKIIEDQQKRQDALELATGVKLGESKSGGGKLTGTTADAIAGGIINGFKAGKKTAEDFADDFKGLMEDALLSSFKSQYLDGAIEEFYKEFAKLSADGLTDAEIEALRARYAEVIASGSGLADAIKKIRGEVVEGLDEGFKTNAFSLLLQSAEETGKSIEQILKDSILEGLKAQIFTDALKPLQAKISALYKDGRIPTKEELAAITAEYTAFIDGAKAKLKEVEDNTGLVFNDKIAEDLRAAAEKIKSEIQSISDSILDVFANSDNALQDFESKFNGMVKNTILKSLQETTLQGRLTEFYTEFQKLSTVSDGEKEAQVAKLRAQYNAIIKEGTDEYKRLQDVFGVDYGSSASKPSAAIGDGVQRITEDTANAIAGPIIGTFEQATKIANLMGKHYAIATQALDMAVKTEANTRRTANNTERLQAIETGINQIAANTKRGGSSLSDSYSKL